MHNDWHPSSEELLLAADGELPSRQASQIRSHLSGCWHCRTRSAEIETTITEFTRAYESAGSSLPPVEGPRALLKAKMEALDPPRAWNWFSSRAGIGVIAVLAIAFGVIIGNEVRTRAHYVYGATPTFSLTPGAIRIVTLEEVCSGGTAARASIPASLRHKVFEEYGMPQSDAASYEVDYLVTPELGGAQDIRNLWPQPYEATVWNAHVKDALEDRLHAMVCSGDIDLPTAQHDIATNWISAYKKYFHTDKPF